MRLVLFTFLLFISFFSVSNHFVKADKLNTYIKATKNHENIRRKPTALAVGGRRGLYFQYILNFSFNISTLDLER